MVGAATVVCEVARDVFGVAHATVFLTVANHPVASIDNMLDDGDHYRRAWFGAPWDVAPLFHELLVHHAPVGEEALGQVGPPCERALEAVDLEEVDADAGHAGATVSGAPWFTNPGLVGRRVG